MKYNYGKKQRGVTLVEIAIVLVIIGLLLGGILKGQELINNAKVRSIADRQNSIKAAWFSFIDRYQALPGDYLQAQQNVPGAGAPLAVNIGATGEGFGDGTIIDTESPYAMQHLTGAGYLRCPQCTYGPITAPAVIAPSAANSLQNQYGGVMAIFVDGAGLGSSAANTDTYVPALANERRPRLGIHTGSNIPSNIIAEVDRKLDDGNPETGDVRASNYSTTALKPAANCLDANITDAVQGDGNYIGLATDQGWRHASVPPEQNCGAFVFI